MDQVGRMVECADCGEEVVVPLIRDGLNPRFREKDPTRRGGLPAPDSVVAVTKRTELLQKGMVSLERRQERQNLKVSHLIRNMELMVRQLDLLEESVIEQQAESPDPVVEMPPPVRMLPDTPTTTANLRSKIPQILYTVSILLGLVVGVWWLVEL